ncbi:MAG: hypothetical protein WD049_06955, partial [Candidatus Paceibacterota bacterium]
MIRRPAAFIADDLCSVRTSADTSIGFALWTIITNCDLSGCFETDRSGVELCRFVYELAMRMQSRCEADQAQCKGA